MDVVAGERFRRALDFRPVLDLERDVMELRLGVVDEIDGVVIGIAAQEGKRVVAPIGDAEAKHVAIELHDLLHVVDPIGDVAEFQRHDAAVRPSSLANT